MKKNVIVEFFYYKGKMFIKYEDNSVNCTTNQQYRDAVQMKKSRIKKGWDRPVRWQSVGV
jgi:hypothetical protein